MRSLLTTLLLITCLILTTGQVEGHSLSPEPDDLTYLSLAQLLQIQVTLPAIENDSLPGGAVFTGRPTPLLPPAMVDRPDAWWRVGPPLPVNFRATRRR